RHHACRAVHSPIGHLIEPAKALIIQVGVAGELSSVDEIAAHVAHRPLHLALGLGAIGPTGPDAEAPVGGESEELRILQELAALQALILHHHRLHLIEEQLPRYAAEVREGLLQPSNHRGHGLPRIELEPEKSRVAEDDEKSESLAPGK